MELCSLTVFELWCSVVLILLTNRHKDEVLLLEIIRYGIE